MKEETFLHKTNTNDEILNSLLKTNFDSNIKDESLDIDMSACVTITSVHSYSGLSSDFWKTLDESAQSSGALTGGDEMHVQAATTTTSPVKSAPTVLQAASSHPPSLLNVTENSKKCRRKTDSPLKHDKVDQLAPQQTHTIFPDSYNGIDVDTLESAGIRFKYKCQHCAILLESLAEFMAHEATHKIIFKCEECGREFENESGFKKHARIHRNGLRKDVWQECPDCGKSLKLGSMWMHRKIHSDSKKYACDVCGQKFVQKINLTNHAKVHSGEKPYECSECQKSFPEKSHLIRHQKYHTSTRPYRCEKCGKMYKTERCLKVHNLVHLEQRPFVCQVCNKSFISNSKLKQHSNIHTGERPYKCNYCSRDFTNFPNWLKHTRRRHKVDHKTGELLENIPTYGSKQKTNSSKNNETATGTKTVAKRRKKAKANEKEDLIRPITEGIENSPDIEIKLEQKEFNDIHCLSLNSAEELIMEQALEMEESGLFHSNNDVHIKFEDFDPPRPIISSLDSSPFSSPASAELPSFSLAIPSIKKPVISTPFPLPSSSQTPSSSIEIVDSNNFFLALTSSQIYPSVDFSGMTANFFQSSHK